MTQVGNVRPDMTGRRVRAVEEPLVARVHAKKVCLLTASVNGLWACSTV